MQYSILYFSWVNPNVVFAAAAAAATVIRLVGTMEEKILFLMWLFTPFATTLVAASPPISFGRVYVNELFSTKIEPKMFNWTLDIMEQFKYRASLHGHPDLPTWMRYMYSREHHAGYLYGTPPEQLSGQEVDPVCPLKMHSLTYFLLFALYY